MGDALSHVRRAIDLLSLSGETADFASNIENPKSWKPFTMCVAEDIDRINGALPSPMFVALSQKIREAWEELKMAEAAIAPPPQDGG